MRTYLVVGLGNVGCKYDNTYHNLGFDCVERLKKRYETIKQKELTYVSLTWLDVEGKNVLIAKPKTYMNNSGSAVANVCKKYNISPDDIIVALDEIDVDMGKYKYKNSGSGGSHKGLKDIVERLGTQDFARVRIGFGPRPTTPLDKLVLSHITKEKRQIVDPAIESATDKIVDFILGRIK